MNRADRKSPTTNRRPLVIAHRGASGHAPENTLAAVDLAWEQGADAVEVDARLTADNRLMIMHDPSALRTTGRDLVVADTPSGILSTLDAGHHHPNATAFEPVPFLEDVAAGVPTGLSLFVELKDSPPPPSVLLDALDASTGRVALIFISFEPRTAADAKRDVPDSRACWLIDVLPPGGFDDVLRIAKDTGLDGIDIQRDLVTADRVNAAHDAGLVVYAWTVNDGAEARMLAVLGVDGLTTDVPDIIAGAFATPA